MNLHHMKFDDLLTLIKTLHASKSAFDPLDAPNQPNESNGIFRPQSHRKASKPCLKRFPRVPPTRYTASFDDPHVVWKNHSNKIFCCAAIDYKINKGK